MEKKSEKDYLEYKGNTVPRVIRLAWTIFLGFAIYYVIANVLPDLGSWLKLVK